MDIDIDVSGESLSEKESLSVDVYRNIISMLTQHCIESGGDPAAVVKALELQLDVTKTRHNVSHFSGGSSFTHTYEDESSARAAGLPEEGVEWTSNGR